jgi:uncharacterized protein YabE (DUF348 family)/3D (Asp-Asp-Asp) domain-containing protein
MKFKLSRILLLSLPLIGLLVGYFLMARPVTISVNGNELTVITRALTVKGALRSAGVTLTTQDYVSPPANTWLSKTTQIEYTQSGLVRVWIDPTGEIIQVSTSKRTPSGIVEAAGLTPNTLDVFHVNGTAVKATSVIDISKGVTLQYTPAVKVTILDESDSITIWTAAATIAEVLWGQGVQVRGGDAVAPDLSSPVVADMKISIHRGVPIEIWVDGRVLQSISAAETVGQALLESGIVLQDLDYSKPLDTEPIPADGKIDVIRVKEEVLLEQISVPYTVEYVSDPELELDQRRVIEQGEYGLQAEQVRIRYENGTEVSRTKEALITLKSPVNRQEAYGAKIVYKTMDTPDGPITYYRAITVTATTYSNCNLGVSWCGYTTAYGLPLKKGMIAVHRAWYNLLKGTQMYVPGYGVGLIADVGYYPYNHNWVDLGYTDAEYALVPDKQKFFRSITVYFLAPAPANVPGIMP